MNSVKHKIVPMKSSDSLNDDNFIQYAIKHYTNKQCHDEEEFYNDLLIPMHLRKLFTRYHVNSILKERLIINHIILLFNVFPIPAACTILFYKIDKKYHTYLKTFLHYLNRYPDTIFINGQMINVKEIKVDEQLLALLEKGTNNANT